MLDMPTCACYASKSKANFTCCRGVYEKSNCRIAKGQTIDAAGSGKPSGGDTSDDHSLEGERYNPSITLAFKLARTFELKIEDIFIYEEVDEA